MENNILSVTTYRPRMNARLIWDLEEFEKNFTPHTSIFSPELNVESDSSELQVKWKAQLYNNSVDLRISLHPQIHAISNIRSFICSYEIVLGDVVDSSIVKNSEGTFVKDDYLPDCKMYRFKSPENSVSVPLQELKCRREEIYPEGTLRVKVDFHMIMPHQSKTGARDFPGLRNAYVSTIEKWTAGLYNNSLYSDVTIKCQDKTYPCHLHVLGRSAVFAAMFSTPMKESITKEIIISDVEPAVLEIFLKSLYSQPFVLPVDYNGLLELMDSAEKYNLVELKVKCLRKLPFMISEVNAGELNVAANRYCQDKEYRQFFKNYCLKNQVALMKNPAYKKIFLENMDLFL